MTVEVTFCLYINKDLCLGESDINDDFDSHRAGLIANTNNYGNVIIRSVGQPEIYIDDEVWATVNNLCLGSIPALLAGEAVVVGYLRYNGEVTLTPKDHQIQISGDFISTSLIESRELLPALLDCGRRYIQFLHRFDGSDVDYVDIIKHLDTQFEIASQALNAT
ncbi:MAG TPA: hypothetical protein VJ302_15050 [Blastocatellia bacterium]|nr:hypothetical protein [Blastocatellia bacterium]